MTEKDPLGDKLRDKEKAEEDRYFAQLDREKLAKLRSRTAGKPPQGACPRCAGALVERQDRGVAIDVCPACGGIWLDRGELEALLVGQDEGWIASWVRSLLGVPR